MKIGLPAEYISDEDALIAAANLVGRTGATSFQLGWLHDDVPVDQMGWYAQAQYKGARIMVENQPGPAEAASELAQKLLTGARCRCGRLVALSGSGAFAYGAPTMTDGTQWTLAEAIAAGQCLWTRTGQRWEPSCRGNRT